jgi:predicted Zn-dependent protease
VAVAQLYIDKKLFDKAQAEINRIKQNKEFEERVLSCQAILFLEQGNYEKALQAVDNALEKYPGSIQSLLTKSKILVKLDRKAEACKYANEGLQKINREYFGEADYVMDFTFQFQDFQNEHCQ